MKRTQPEIILAASFQRDPVADNTDDVTRLPDLFPPIPVFYRFQISRFILPVWP